MKREVTTESLLLPELSLMYPDSSTTTLRKMLAADRVRVNGELVRDAKRALRSGDVIAIDAKPSTRSLHSSLTLLHEDEWLLVIIKSAGLLTVASPSDKENTAQAYINTYLKMRGEERVHVVHRLDRESSGVLVFAKSYETREALKELFAAHDIDRIYVAIVEGQLTPPDGTISSHLAEDRSLKVRSVAPQSAGAKLAVTHYRTVRSGAKFSELEVTLETGRKNQIRVHMSEASHPIVGDQLYGSALNPIGRLGLHARLLGFVHPGTGTKLVFEAPIPEAFRSFRL